MGFLFGERKTDFVYDFDLPFMLTLRKCEFIREKCISIYKMLLISCLNHSKGFTEEQQAAVWDNWNILTNYRALGAVSLIAEAMASRGIAYIVYDKKSNLTRVAVGDEINLINEDYKKYSRSDRGIIVNFENFTQSDLLKAYLEILYNTLDSMNTQTQLSRAVRIKMYKLRETLSNNSKEEAVTQAKAIAAALKNGRGALLDKDDEIDITKIDVSPAKAQAEFIMQLIAGELGVSLGFVNGALTSGIGSSGENEIEANEKGIKFYFSSIFKPCFDLLMNVNLKFVTDNYRKIAELAKILPYLESSELIDQKDAEKFAKSILGDDNA